MARALFVALAVNATTGSVLSAACWQPRIFFSVSTPSIPGIYMIQKNKIMCLIFNRLLRFSPGLHNSRSGDRRAPAGLPQSAGSAHLSSTTRSRTCDTDAAHYCPPPFPVLPWILQKTGEAAGQRGEYI